MLNIIWGKETSPFFLNLKYLFASIVLGATVFVSYSNTFHASWHLDDLPNIVDSFYLHIDHLSAKSLLDSLYSNPHNPFELNHKMYRPVACLSFALNWYFGKDDVFGYHIVNTAIHFFSALFLFFFILKLFQTPRLTTVMPTSGLGKDCCVPEELSNKIFVTALFATLFWAVHPIQTQAVTYIVQRMASMSAMFYIMGMWGYLKGRLSKDSRRLIWYGCSFICFILSLNSKENGVMLPISLLLIEIVFFQDLSDRKTIRQLFIAALIVGSVLFILGTFLFLNKNPLSILNYQNRTFSLTERLLVQPRVLIFHLSQFFLPLPERFSIAHDFILSSSLFRPWSTVPSILLILSLIAFALYEARRFPLISFAILFFFINHIIESTLFPLEIVFEHRNYLPSMFLPLPIAFWAGRLLDKYRYQKKSGKYSLVVFLLITTAITLSVSTYIRNKVWENDILLWSDAYRKAPNNARAANILAIRLAWGDSSSHPNRYDKAIELFKKSLTMDMPSVNITADILGNIASVYSNNKKDYQQAVQFFQKAVATNPDSLKIRRDMVNTLILMGNYDEALTHTELLISRNGKNWVYHNFKGFILLWQGKYSEAFPNFQAALRLFHEQNDIPSSNILFNIGVNLSLKGDHLLSEEVLENVRKMAHEDISIYFALIENSLRAEDKIKAGKYTYQMVSRFGSDTVLKNINVVTDNRALAPISREIIEPFVKDSLAR